MEYKTLCGFIVNEELLNEIREEVRFSTEHNLNIAEILRLIDVFKSLTDEPKGIRV